MIHQQFPIKIKKDEKTAHYGLIVCFCFLQACIFLKWIPIWLLNHRVVLHPYLILKGYIPFKEIISQKTDLLPIFLAMLLPLFNEDAVFTARVFHLFIISLLLAILMLVLFSKGGIIASLSGGIFYLTWSRLFGNWAIAYYDLVLGLIFLIAFFLLSSRGEKLKRNYLLLGLLSAVGFLIKQQGIILIFISVIWLIYKYVRTEYQYNQLIHGLIALAGGFLIPVSVYLLHLLKLGVSLGEFFYWIVVFNLPGNYASAAYLPITALQFWQIFPSLILLPVFFLNGKIFRMQDCNTLYKDIHFLLMLFLLAGFSLIYPRFSNRHLSTVLPFLAIISGLCCADIFSLFSDLGKKWIGGIFYIGIIFWWVVLLVANITPNIINPKVQSFNEYSELIPLARQLNNNIYNSSSIAIYPIDESNANLYYILGKSPPRFYLMFYPWFIKDFTVTAWIQALANASPEVIIYFKDYAEQLPVPEIDDYIQLYYQPEQTLSWQGMTVQLLSRKQKP